jgi:cytidyltransferase-like protein
MSKKVVCCSGLFDPLHYGHVDYLQKAKKLSTVDGQPGTLWVIVNSDKQAISKKGYSFMPEAERLKLVRALQCVDAVIIAPDEDDSVCRALSAINPDIFAIGLDEGPEYVGYYYYFLSLWDFFQGISSIQRDFFLKFIK